MKIELKKKGNLKNLKTLSKNYKRIVLSDFFNGSYLFRKNRKVSWQPLIKWSRTNYRKIKKNFKISQKKNKLIRPRIPFIIQTDSILHFSQFLGTRKILTKKQYFRKIFLSLLLNFKNNKQIKKNFGKIFYRSKGSTSRYYNYIILKYSNNIQNIFFINKFLVNKSNIIYSLSKNKYLGVNRRAINYWNIKKIFIKTGMRLKYRPSVFFLREKTIFKDRRIVGTPTRRKLIKNIKIILKKRLFHKKYFKRKNRKYKLLNHILNKQLILK